MILLYRAGMEQQLVSQFDRPLYAISAPGPRPRESGPEQRNHAEHARIEDVPDYKPAFSQGSLHADRSGNLWIRTNKFAGGQPVYDVINRAGRLIDRVQLPPYRTIAGFGRDVVLMAVRDSSGVVHLERARLR